MSRPISDDRMRALWRTRCQARREIEACHKVIQDQTLAERVHMRRCEREAHWARRDLIRGLRQRGNVPFQIRGGTWIRIGYDGDLETVWGFQHGHTWQPYRSHAAKFMERREAVAC